MLFFGLISTVLLLLNFGQFNEASPLTNEPNDKKALKAELYKVLSKLATQNDFEWKSDEAGVKSHLFPYNDQVEGSLLLHPTISLQSKLCDSYLTQSTLNENSPQRFSAQSEESVNAFLESVSKTPVFQSALDYLSEKGHSSKSTAEVFEQLKGLWSSRALQKSFCQVKTGDGQSSGGNWLAFYLAQSKRLLADQDVEVMEENLFEGSSNSALQKVVVKFAKRDGPNLKNEQQLSLLTGTTPEFELAAFTICALASNGEEDNQVTVKKCKFAIDRFGNEIKAVVSTSNEEGLKILEAHWDLGSEERLAMEEGKHNMRDVHMEDRKKKKKNNTVAVDPELQKLVDKMWIADSEDRVSNDSVRLDWGNHVDGQKDVSPNPLFNNVSEAFMKRPIYSTLLDIYNQSLFHPPVCTAEAAMDDRRHAVLDNFLNVVTNTSTFQLAYNFLKSRNYTGTDFATFRKTLFSLWFGGYTRCDGTIGSSGWEHVFSGEWRDTIVDGHHNWVRFYLGEKAKEVDYHGYYVYRDNLIGTIQYKWKNQLKKIGGFLFLTSPAFDFSLFTVCSFAHVGNEKCRFSINGNKLFVTSFKQTCSAGTCLSTSYPGIKGG